MKTRIVIYVLWALAIVLLVAFIIKTNNRITFDVSSHDPVLGNEEAPLTIVMFGSYQCSVSQSFFEEHYPKLKSDYIDTGRARFVYKNYYANTDNNQAGPAEAALCANDQGKFWEYNSVLFSKKNEWQSLIGSSSLEETFNPIFNQYAANLSLNQNEFIACIRGHQHLNEIKEDYAYARNLGVKQTPSFLINGFVINGLPSGKDFELLLTKFQY